MSIATPYETTGTRTSWVAEKQFSTDLIAASPRVAISNMGASEAYGREMRLWRIGHPSPPALPTAGTPNSILFTASIHGNEYMAREAALELIRDLAFTTDPDVVAYLAAHPVYVMSTCNPDRVDDPVRGTVNGTDINRDHFKLSQGETRGIWEAIRRVQPVIQLDMHEYAAVETTNLAPLPPAHPQIAPQVHAAGRELMGVLGDALAPGGWTIGEYTFASRTLPVMLCQAASLATGAIGFTPETSTFVAEGGRLTVQRIVAWAVIEWHRTNATRLRGVVDVGRATKTLEGSQGYPAYQLMDSDAVLAQPPAAYKLTGVQYAATAPQRLAFGLEMVPDGDGWLVPMGQPAQPVIPLLFDKESPYNVAVGDRVYTNGPVVPSAWGPFRIDGTFAEVTEVSRVVEGEVCSVWVNPS